MAGKKHVTIAIDGPAGAGKSTVARLIAKKFGLLYIDSGAMYRAVAWRALTEAIDISDENAVGDLVARMHIELHPSEDGTSVFADGQEVTAFIRKPEVTEASSKIATFARVREVLVARQQQIGRERGVVMEGRDIGSVVFPAAPLKFYLDASINERARRRKEDLKRAGIDVEQKQLEQQVAERDSRDMTRLVGPLRKLPDAIVIDTSNMSIEEVVQTIYHYVVKFLHKTVQQ